MKDCILVFSILTLFLVMFLSLQKDNRIKNSATKCLEIGYIYDVNFDKCFHPKSMIGIPQ